MAAMTCGAEFNGSSTTFDYAATRHGLDSRHWVLGPLQSFRPRSLSGLDDRAGVIFRRHRHSFQSAEVHVVSLR